MLPSDYNARKNLPMLTVLASYFPDAIEALVALCVQGNVQHKVDANAVNPFKLPGDMITWDRSKSTDQVNTLFRHLWDHERAKRSQGSASLYDSDGVLHATKAFWRAGAELQLTIEALQELEARESLGHPAWPCHGGPIEKRCDSKGPGGFMGHTCLPTLRPAPVPPGTADRRAVAAAPGGKVDSKTHDAGCSCEGCRSRRVTEFVESTGGGTAAI